MLDALKSEHDRSETPTTTGRISRTGWASCGSTANAYPNSTRWPSPGSITIVSTTPRPPTTKTKSAELGRGMCVGLGHGELADRVAELILDTRHQAEPRTLAGQWLVGIDLAILGETEERFTAFDREHPHRIRACPRPALPHRPRPHPARSSLSADEIYQVPELKERFEARARANLKAALAAL